MPEQGNTGPSSWWRDTEWEEIARRRAHQAAASSAWEREAQRQMLRGGPQSTEELAGGIEAQIAAAQDERYRRLRQRGVDLIRQQRYINAYDAAPLQWGTAIGNTFVAPTITPQPAPGGFAQAYRAEVDGALRDMQQRFNQQLFNDAVQPHVSSREHRIPLGEEDTVPETLKKRSREMKLMYPFAIDHGGRSYRMSYNSSARRWRLQEWDNKRCEKLHETFVRGQALAHATRQKWMEARTAELEPTR